MRGVDDRDGAGEMQEQIYILVAAGGALRRQCSVGLHHDAVEERQGRNHVGGVQSVLRRRQREHLAAGRRRRMNSPGTIFRDVPGEGAGTAQGVVMAGGVGDDGRECTTLVAEQRVTGSEVRLPRHLDRVGDIEPLPRCISAPQEDVRTSGAGHITQSQACSAGKNLHRVTPTGNRLRPRHVVRGDVVGQRCPRRCRHHRHGVGDGGGLCPRMLAGTCGGAGRTGCRLGGRCHDESSFSVRAVRSGRLRRADQRGSAGAATFTGIGCFLPCGKQATPSRMATAIQIGPAHFRMGISPAGSKISDRGHARFTTMASP